LEHDYLVSNDEDIHGVWDRLLTERAKAKDDENGPGLALFIGQGAVFSLLPHLGSELPIIVDYNPVVADFSKLTQESIQETEKPADAIEKILDTVSSGWLEQTPPNYSAYVKRLIVSEKRNHRGIHWSEEKNFESVREAISTNPVEAIVGDIMNPDFLQAFQAVQGQFDLPVTFANITNLVEYARIHSGIKDNSFITKIGIADRALILFSSHQGKGYYMEGYPSFRLARGPKNLIDATSRLCNLSVAGMDGLNDKPLELLFLD
jgi:hypothetical protein